MQYILVKSQESARKEPYNHVDLKKESLNRRPLPLYSLNHTLRFEVWVANVLFYFFGWIIGALNGIYGGYNGDIGP